MKTISIDEARRLVKEGAACSREERLQLQRNRLKELVDYVRQNSPYFAKLYADLPSDYDLTDLPFTEKPTLLAHYDDWVTDRRLNLQVVLDYVNRDPIKDQSLLLGQYTALRTSGSTGNPLPMVRDDYHNKIHGQLSAQRLLGDMGNLLDLSKHRVASIIHLSNGASSYGSLLRIKAAFPDTADNLLGLSVLDSVDSIVARLNEFQPDSMTGYPSMLAQLAVEQLQGRLHLSIKGVITSAEMLSLENYNLLKQAFQCTVANNYCMTEGGEVAMAYDTPHLHVNEDWIIVEPVDDNCRPLGMSDEWSSGVLITDLSNFVQPIIRYHVGDVIRIRPSDEPGNTLPVMQIQGRTFGNYTICGKTFNVSGIFAKTEVWPDVVRFQFVQTADDTIEVRAVCKSAPERTMPGLCKQLQAFLAELGCPGARFTWSTEPLIPNKRGGKIPIYVKL